MESLEQQNKNLYENCLFCDLEVYKPNIQTHEAACERAFMQMASNDQVKQKQSYIKLKKEFSENKDETISCPQCDKQITFLELDNHDKVCENKLVVCLYCNDWFPRLLMQQHIEVCTKKGQLSQKQQEQVMQQQQKMNPSIFPVKKQIQQVQKPQYQQIQEPVANNGFNFQPILNNTDIYQQQKQQILSDDPKCQKCCKSLQPKYDPYQKMQGFNQEYNINMVNAFQCDNCQGYFNTTTISYNCQCFNGGYDLCQQCFETLKSKKQNNSYSNNNQKNNIIYKQQKIFSQPKIIQKQQINIQQQVQKPIDDHFQFQNKKLSDKEAQLMQEKINKILDSGGDISQFNLEDHDLTNVGGIKKELKDQLPVINFNSNAKITDDENKKCCICMNEFIHQEKLLLLPCTHRFHDDCIDHWIKKNPTCPLCHKDITKLMGN